MSPMKTEPRPIEADELARLCEGIVYIIARVASDGVAGSGVYLVKVRELVSQINKEHRHLHPRAHAFLANRAPYPVDVNAALKALEDSGDLRRTPTYLRVTREPNLALFSKEVLNTMQIVMDRFISEWCRGGHVYTHRPTWLRPAKYGEWSESGPGSSGNTEGDS